MQFALVNNERTAPSTGLVGSCPCCNSPMIAKCGHVRIHHWSHKGQRNCDPWWENETQWHRDWKSSFPELWREVIRHDDRTGEKHIADIRTEHALTIEFQHSHIRPEERASREAFYGNMVWVVNGSRLMRDLPRFKEGSYLFRRTLLNGIFITPFPEHAFPPSWLHSAAPVFFDFADTPETDTRQGHLWCLLPGRVLEHAVVIRISRQTFVRFALERQQLFPVKEIQVRVGHEMLAEYKRRAEAARLLELENARRLVQFQRQKKPFRRPSKTFRKSRWKPKRPRRF